MLMFQNFLVVLPVRVKPEGRRGRQNACNLSCHYWMAFKTPESVSAEFNPPQDGWNKEIGLVQDGPDD